MMNSLHAWGKQINHKFTGGSRSSSKHNGNGSTLGAGTGDPPLNGANAGTKLSHSASSDSGCSEIHTSSSEQECHKLGLHHSSGGLHHHHHHHHLHHLHNQPHHPNQLNTTANTNSTTASNTNTLRPHSATPLQNTTHRSPTSHLSPSAHAAATAGNAATTPRSPVATSPIAQATSPPPPHHQAPPSIDAPFFLPWQTMISVATFVDFVKNRDIGRIKYAIREADFKLDTHDEEGRTALHHALVQGVMENDMEVVQQLINFGSDVCVKDEVQQFLRINTPQRETAIHVALRLGHLDAVKAILEAPSFDVVRCDAYQRDKMLPSVSIIDDIFSQMPPDADSTLTKRRSFGDQFLLFVRQNTRDYMENNFPPGRESIRDMIIIQDECLPRLHEILPRIDYAQLSTLYIIDCKLQLDDVEFMKDFALTTLVLQHNHLRQLPKSIFEIETLQVLRVDRNNLEEIPQEIGMLRNLKSFTCDNQRPRLRSLPHSITKLEHLQILSFNNNRIDNLSWVVALPHLQCLRCSMNRISRLPNQLANLQDLMVLDVSHNRLEYIPPSFVDLIRRLYLFEYYNLTLRPKHILQGKAALLSYLELEAFLAQSPVRRTVRDISIAIVGESHSGKSTLVEALKAEKGICKQEVRHESTFEIHQFEMHGNDNSTYISTIVLANEILDNFSRNINVDMFLLVVDLTSLELQNGSQHLFARHVSRMQMWLQALYETSPDTPVLVVGTHAEMVKAMSFQDIWHIMEGLLDQGRSHHIKRYADSRISNCLLCAPKHLAIRHVIAKSRSGSAGFVDLSYPHGEPMMNGHVPTGDNPPPGKNKMPHVVGYYEIDSKKNLPKDAKKNNVSIEQLKSAIFRLTAGCPDDGIPPSWLSFIRQVATITEQAPNLPCIPYEEVVSISRSFEIPPAQVPYMLQYFHQRGKLVFFDGDEVLSKLVVINPTWFIQMLSRVLEGFEASRCSLSELIDALQDKELDRQLQKAGILSLASAHWLLAALQRLDLCVPLIDNRDEKVFLLPNLLELGYPSHDIWPDLPEWDEKQITCDFAIRKLKPLMFMDLILRLNRQGRKELEIVSDPAPVYLSHHIVFFTGIDVGGCDDCYCVRRRLRQSRHLDNLTTDDVLHKVHIQLSGRMDSLRIAVRGVSPCCAMKAVLNFLELYFDDIPEEDMDNNSDRTSISSHALSSASASHSGHSMASSDHGSIHSYHDDDDERQCFLLCPKCVLLRQANPERISYTSMSPRRKAICSKWHNLGSWTRAMTGDYRFTDCAIQGTALQSLPDYEHPRLVVVLPPSQSVSQKDWYMSARMKFLEGFEVHFLCEYTGYWHMTEDSGFRLHQTPEFLKRVGNQMPMLLNLALPLVQIINGIHEHGLNGRLLAPVIADMIKTYDYLRHVDPHIQDPYTWLTKNKDRVVTMLTKVLANASDGFPDLYFKVGNAINADSVFQAPSKANRYELARFLRCQASSGRFGPLRPLYVGREIRWLCDDHYEELRSMPSK